MVLGLVAVLAEPDRSPRNFDATQFGGRVALGPEWLFQPGDDLAWAQPGFDDRGWKTISANKELTDYGIPYAPRGWYRMHVRLRPDARDVSLGLDSINGSYEVYANGVRIGGNGRMQGLLFYVQSRLLAFPIPQQLLGGRGDLILAIRFAINSPRARYGGGPTPISPDSGVYLLSGESSPREASYRDTHASFDLLLLSALSLLIGMVALALYLALRTQTEYLAAAVYLLVSSAFYVDQALTELVDVTPADSWVYISLFGAVNFLQIEFVRLVLRQRRTWWILAVEAIAVSCGFGSKLVELGLGNYYLGLASYFAPLLLGNFFLILLLFRALVRGNRDARMLLPAILLKGVYFHWLLFRNVEYALHLIPVLHAIELPSLGSYRVGLGQLTTFLFLIAILLFLVVRTVGIARDRQRAAGELEAARVVQQVMIPEEIPNVPGFRIGAVYRPFGEVGGDFFQILPAADGVLVVIEDVSGKGMPAAMTVSLLVGTVRTLAHYTQSPGEILAAMNERMIGRSNGGFTTCLVLRADCDGTLTVANAGHIAPFLAGLELAFESGLPLGLAAEVEYAEGTFLLCAGEQLTLVTDGVAEARAKGGELLGFERTAELSTCSAEAIADAAQGFGQDDDITVLTVKRVDEGG
jgi:hypothetical protein